jgi:hypothetical protein
MECNMEYENRLGHPAIVLSNNYRYEVRRVIECPMCPSEPT